MERELCHCVRILIFLAEKNGFFQIVVLQRVIGLLMAPSLKKRWYNG